MTRRDPDRPRFVAGSIGPTNKTLSMGVNVEDPGHRDVTFDEMVANYTEQIRGLVAGGVDLLLPETSFDTLVLKACLFAIDKYFEETGTRLPVMVSGTIFDERPDAVGADARGVLHSVSHFDALSVGLNCAVGVDQMRGRIESLAAVAPDARQLLPQRRHARRLRRLPRRHRSTWPASLGEFAAQRLAEHRRRLLRHDARVDRRHRRGRRGRRRRGRSPTCPRWSTYSGTEPLVVRPETNFVMVGERTNITGSKQFARLIKEANYEEAAGRRPRAGRGRRQHPRHQHGRGPDRRRGGDDAVPEPGLGRARHRQASRS